MIEENHPINIPSYEKWKILSNEIEVNTEIIKKIMQFEGIKVNDHLFSIDHKIEIITNFLVSIKKNISIVPIILGKPNSKKLEEFSNIINQFINNPKNSFIFLSYFLSKSIKEEKVLKAYKELKKIINEKQLKLNILLDLYKSKRITPENIGGVMLSHQLFNEYLFSNYTIKTQGNDLLISEDILMN